MKNIVLFEGVDKAGKTTLLNDLVLALPKATVFKNVIKPEGKEPVMIGRTGGIYLGAYQLANATNGRTLFDRSHITEIVYSHRRGYSSLNHLDWLSYEEMFLKDACLVYVSSPVDVIKKRFEKDNETYVEKTEITGIMERYDDYLTISKLDVLLVDGTGDRQRNLTNLIKFIGQ